MERLGSQWKDFHDIRHLRIFRKPVYKLQFRLKPNNISGTSQKYLCVFMTISRWILLRMRNVSDKICIKNENTPIFCPITFFFLENRAVYEIMWKNIVEPDRPQMTIRRMRIACWITKATNIHSDYVTLVAFSTTVVHWFSPEAQ